MEASISGNLHIHKKEEVGHNHPYSRIGSICQISLEMNDLLASSRFKIYHQHNMVNLVNWSEVQCSMY